MTSGLARGLLLAGAFLPLALVAIAVFWMVAMPGRSFRGTPIALDDEGRATSKQVRGHLLALGRDIGERNLNWPEVKSRGRG